MSIKVHSNKIQQGNQLIEFIYVFLKFLTCWIFIIWKIWIKDESLKKKKKIKYSTKTNKDNLIMFDDYDNMELLCC